MMAAGVAPASQLAPASKAAKIFSFTIRLASRSESSLCSANFASRRLTTSPPSTLRRRPGLLRFPRNDGAGPPQAPPQILAVDHRHRHGIEIEIIQQPCIDTNSRILEIGLTGRPVRRFGIGATAAIGTKMVFDRTALPLIGRNVLHWSGQAELRRRVVGP